MTDFDFVRKFPVIRGSDGRLYSVCDRQEYDWQIANKGATYVKTVWHMNDEDCQKRYPRLTQAVMRMGYSARESGQRIALHRWMRELGRKSMDTALIERAVEMMRWRRRYDLQSAKRQSSRPDTLTSV